MGAGGSDRIEERQKPKSGDNDTCQPVYPPHFM